MLTYRCEGEDEGIELEEQPSLILWHFKCVPYVSLPCFDRLHELFVPRGIALRIVGHFLCCEWFWYARTRRVLLCEPELNMIPLVCRITSLPSGGFPRRDMHLLLVSIYVLGVVLKFPTSFQGCICASSLHYWESLTRWRSIKHIPQEGYLYFIFPVVTQNNYGCY